MRNECDFKQLKLDTCLWISVRVQVLTLPFCVQGSQNWEEINFLTLLCEPTSQPLFVFFRLSASSSVLLSLLVHDHNGNRHARARLLMQSMMDGLCLGYRNSCSRDTENRT